MGGKKPNLNFKNRKDASQPGKKPKPKVPAVVCDDDQGLSSSSIRASDEVVPETNMSVDDDLISVEVLLEAVNQRSPLGDTQGLGASSVPMNVVTPEAQYVSECDSKSSGSVDFDLSEKGLEQGEESVAKMKAIPERKKPWKELLFSNNRREKVSDDAILEEVGTLEEPVMLEMDDYEVIHEKFDFALVGFITGRNIGRGAIIQCCKSWKVPHQVQFHDSGWIIVKFEKEEDRDTVIENGPYMIYGRVFLVKIMPEAFQMDERLWCKVPLWVRLPNLMLELWNKKALSKIVSKIGKPIRMDKVTLSRQRKTFARVLVEVDISKDLVDFVSVINPYGCFDQRVEYEEGPSYCKLCKAIGHVEEYCSRKVKEKEKLVFKTYIIDENDGVKDDCEHGTETMGADPISDDTHVDVAGPKQDAPIEPDINGVENRSDPPVIQLEVGTPVPVALAAHNDPKKGAGLVQGNGSAVPLEENGPWISPKKKNMVKAKRGAAPRRF